MTDTNYLYEYFLKKSGDDKKPDKQKDDHVAKRAAEARGEKEGKEHV